MSNFTTNINNIKERRAFYFKLKLSALIILLLVVIEIIDSSFHLNLENLGVKPRQLDGLIGIFTFPFIHGDWNHLISNSFSLFVLLTGIFIFHENRSLLIVFTLYISSGALLWFIGRENSVHIGASGLIYALASYLFVASIKIRNRNAMALSFFMVLMYGSMVWGVLPFFVESNVSWEGHLAGAVVGTLLALYHYRNYIPEHLLVEKEEDIPFFEKHKDFDL